MNLRNVHIKERATESTMSTFKNMFRLLMIRLYTQLPGRARNQRGASALEYIVLAAALIIIIGALATNETVQTTINTAFTDLFTDASNAGGS
jgi:Flp pilus assembly pilin Flp